MPDVLLRREGLFDRMAGALGFDDIDFESVEFSRRFHVKSSDKRFAYDLIDAGMMQFLLQDGDGLDGRQPCVDLGDDALCVWYGQSTRLDPPHLVALLRWGNEFFRRWPRMLRARLDESTPR